MTKRNIILTIIIVIVLFIALKMLNHRFLQGDDQTNTNASQQTSSTQTNTPADTADQRNYHNDKYGFSLDLPLGFKVDENYAYQNMGPGKDIPGVSFTVPSTISAGTNLSSASYISVERLTNATPCTSSLFTSTPSVTTETYKDNGVTYTRDESSGAGAGNQYNEIVYALPGTPCTAVRYFIHTTSVANYPAGTVKEYDRAALISIFDKIRRSLILK